MHIFPNRSSPIGPYLPWSIPTFQSFTVVCCKDAECCLWDHLKFPKKTYLTSSQLIRNAPSGPIGRRWMRSVSFSGKNTASYPVFSPDFFAYAPWQQCMMPFVPKFFVLSLSLVNHFCCSFIQIFDVYLYCGNFLCQCGYSLLCTPYSAFSLSSLGWSCIADPKATIFHTFTVNKECSSCRDRHEMYVLCKLFRKEYCVCMYFDSPIIYI